MKRVTFQDPPKIQYIVAWDFAYRQARKKYWEYCVIDRYRFQRRITDFENIYRNVRHRQLP